MMDPSAASAYIYSKASGMLAKSFTGSNAEKLFSVKSLKELYSLLFSDEIPSIPEIMLAKEIESKAAQKFHDDYQNLLKTFSAPAKILSEIFKFYEHENSSDNDNQEDEQYVRNLWSAVKELPSSERENLEKFIKQELSMKNILWALRLKVYYQMSPEEILKRLAYSDNLRRKHDILAGEAISILEKDIGSYDDWKDWKYAAFLNPHEEGVVWEIDPTWVEKAAKQSLMKLYRRSFHKDPMSVLSFVSWFKIKENELDYIRSVAEGLRLDAGQDKIMAAAGFGKNPDN